MVDSSSEENSVVWGTVCVSLSFSVDLVVSSLETLSVSEDVVSSLDVLSVSTGVVSSFDILFVSDGVVSSIDVLSVSEGVVSPGEELSDSEGVVYSGVDDSSSFSSSLKVTWWSSPLFPAILEIIWPFKFPAAW